MTGLARPWGLFWALLICLGLHGQVTLTPGHTPAGTGWSTGGSRLQPTRPTQLLVRLAPSRAVSGGRSAHAPSRELLERLGQPQASPLASGAGLEAASPEGARLARTFVLRPPQGTSAEAWLEKVRRDPEVEHAELNAILQTQQVSLPNDPYLSSTGTWKQWFADLYGIHNIHAPKAWQTSTGAGVVVAVIDTGIDLRHPDLRANLWTNPRELAGNGLDDDGNGLVDDLHGWDFVGAEFTNPTPGPDPTDHHGHGTHVAGTVAAVAGNGIGVAGVAPNAKVMALKAMDDFGRGPIDTLVKALLYAQAQGARVANLSLGFVGTSEVLHDAIQAVTAKGMVVVVAAGNNAGDVMDFCPAQFPEVITVGACQESSYPAGFTNYGIRVDVLAPGSQILSCRAAGTSLGPVVGEDYCLLDGTSMATPHGAGVAALLVAQRPGVSPEAVRQLLRAAANRPFDLFEPPLMHGTGVLDAAAAVARSTVVELHLAGVPGFDGWHAADVQGLVRGAGLGAYTLEYGVGRQPKAWTLLQGGVVPQGTAALGRLDPSRLPEGELVLRLSALDASSGALYRDHSLVKVDLVDITDPEQPAAETMARQFKPGSPIPIQGYIRGMEGSYSVAWAQGVMPDQGWTSMGVELAAGASAPKEGHLATWTPPVALPSGHYTLRLSWQDGALTRQAHSVIHLEPDLYAGAWPQFLDIPAQWHVGWFQASDALGNPLLGLGLNSGSFGGGAYVDRVRPDGVRLDRTEFSWGGLSAQPLAGDLLPTPGLEAILGDGEERLRFLKADGTFLPFLEDSQRMLNMQPPVAVTLKDGTRAIAQLALANTGEGRALHLVRLEDGTPLPGFPLALRGEQGFVDAMYAPSLMAVGDLDGDGTNELLVASLFADNTYGFQCVNVDGTLRPWSTARHPGPMRGLALADLDGKGTLDLIHLDNVGGVHVQRWDGSDRPGWPLAPVAGLYGNGLAAGDVDGDGRAEIVAVTMKSLHVLKADGSPAGTAWPQNLEWNALDQFDGGVRILDVDGDGKQEVVLIRYTSSQRPWLTKPPYTCVEPTLVIEAYNVLGAKVRTWSVMGMRGERPLFAGALTFGDFDGDGLTELAAHLMLAPRQNFAWCTHSMATLLRTGAPWRPGTHDWPGVAGDATNRSLVRRDRMPPSVTILSPAPGALLGVGTAAEVRATDVDGIAQVGLQLDGRELDRSAEGSGFRFVLKGASGRHTLRAWAENPTGWRGWSTPVEVELDAQPPVLRIASPPSGSLVTGRCVVEVPTTDDLGGVQVGLQADGAEVGSPLTTPPYRFDWQPRAGRNTLRAWAKDRVGNLAWSEPVTVDGDLAPPAVSIRKPLAGTAVQGEISVELAATDDLVVLQAGLQVDGQEVGTPLLVAPYQFSWYASPGQRTLRAWATDRAGRKGWSDPVVVTAEPLQTIATLSLVEGPEPSVPGDRLRVKVQVQPATATGTVRFAWGGAEQGSASLASGEAVWEVPALVAGTFVLTATYAGDARCAASTSPALVLHCYDFTLAATSAVTLRGSGSASTTVTLKPLADFDGQASFTCTGLPAGISARFGNLVKGADGTYSALLTFSRTATPSVALHLGGAVLCLGLLRRRRRGPVALLGALLMLAVLGACSGKGEPPPEVSTVTVQATRGSLVRTCPVTLNVYR